MAAAWTRLAFVVQRHVQWLPGRRHLLPGSWFGRADQLECLSIGNELSRASLFLVLGCGAGTATATGSSDPAETSESSVTASSGAESTTAVGPPSNCEPTTAGVFATVFSVHCTLPACHSSMLPAVGLDLSDAAGLEGALIGISSACDGSSLIVAGDSPGSLLYRKLDGTPPCGDAMPIGAPLDPALVECVALWIDGLTSTCEQCGGPSCIDVSSDPLHCGGCDTPCPSGAPCVDGTCQCPPPQTACGTECVDTISDPSHCGGCDLPCDMFCLAGSCVADCGGLQACGGACVDTQTNPAHCGGCDQPCDAGEACDAGACACSGDAVSFSTTVGPLLVAECTGAGCHTGPVPKAGLDLRQANAYAELVGVASSQCADQLRVAPGDAGGSYLVSKLRGVDLCSGTQMPKAGAALNESDIVAIESWICRGAEDN